MKISNLYLNTYVGTCKILDVTSRCTSRVQTLFNKILHIMGMGLKRISPKGYQLSLKLNKKLGKLAERIESSTAFRYLIGLPILDLRLAFWAMDPRVKGKKWEAVDKIQFAYKEWETHLQLDNLDLNSAPPAIGMVKGLGSIKLKGNQLRELPQSIGKLKKMSIIMLEDNQFKKFPSVLCRMEKLELIFFSGNRLNSIPKEISKCKKLAHIALGSNRFRKFPEELLNSKKLVSISLNGNQIKKVPSKIGKCKKLKLLDLDDNRIDKLPAEIEGLELLRVLHLKNNKLTGVPTQIGSLKLRELDLFGNDLEELPAEISDLRNLFSLNLSHNKRLKELPLGMGNMPDLTHLSVDGTSISSEEVALVLENAKARRLQEMKKKFEPKVKTWVLKSQRALSFSKLNDFSEEEKGHIYEWLIRLEKTKDYSKNQQKLACAVCEILELVINDSEFKSLFFSQVEANNENCQDRAAMALNEIYTSMLMHNSAGDDKTQLDLLIGCAKTLALRSAVAKLIDAHQKSTKHKDLEAVQIYLYCETKFKKLGLKTAVDGMAFEEIGKRNWIDMKKLEKQVNQTYLDFLVTIPALEKFLEKNEKYTSKKEENVRKVTDKLNDLLENPPNASKESAEYLDWNIEVNKLNKQREDKIILTRKEFIEKLIK